jgi:TctA family transporter
VNINRKTIIDSLWFALEVVGIFVVIQLIRFVIGNLNAFYSGLSLVLIAATLFCVAFLIARNKDRNQRRSDTKTYNKLLN